MTNKKTLIDKIKEIVFAEDTVEAKFLDIKDSEGNILRVDGEELGEGQVLWLVGEGEGELLPTPEAVYVLEEDGRTIKTDADSIIIEIIEAEEEEEEEEVVEEEVEEEMSEEEDVVVEVETIDEKISKTINRKTAELEEKLDNLLAKFEAFSKAPADEEIKIEKVGFSKKQNQDNALDALSKFRNKK